MPLSSPTAAPPTALQLNRQAAEDMPDYAHPLTEELVRRIAAGEITGEQAFNEAQAHVQQFSGAPGALPPTALGAAPQQASLGATPQAPAPHAPQQAALQAPMQAPQQPAQQPRRAPGIAPEVPGAPGAAPSLAPQQPQPAAPPANNQQQDPLANANNMNAAPSFSANVAKGRNQIGDALTNTQAPPQRNMVGQESGAQGAEQQAQGPQAPATGYQAARNAIFGLGPRMTNKDVAVFMQAFVQGGKPALEMEKERGRAFRAGESNRIKSRAVDARAQRVNDQWEVETSRLSLDKQREADRLALQLEGFELARQKLQAAAFKFGAQREDKVALLDMKNAHDEMMRYVSEAGRMGASLMAEAPTTNALIKDAQQRAGEAALNYKAIRDFTVATQSNAGAPAPGRAGTGPVPAMETAGEASKKVTGKTPAKTPARSPVSTQKAAGPRAQMPTPSPQDPDPEIQVRRKSDGAMGMVRTSKFNSNTYEMVSK